MNADEVEWILQGRAAVHIVAEYTVEGTALPWCRVAKGTPFTKAPRERGYGAQAARAAGPICESCLKSAPTAVRALFLDFD